MKRIREEEDYKLIKNNTTCHCYNTVADNRSTNANKSCGLAI